MSTMSLATWAALPTSVWMRMYAVTTSNDLLAMPPTAPITTAADEMVACREWSGRPLDLDASGYGAISARPTRPNVASATRNLRCAGTRPPTRLGQHGVAVGVAASLRRAGVDRLDQQVAQHGVRVRHIGLGNALRSVLDDHRCGMAAEALGGNRSGLGSADELLGPPGGVRDLGQRPTGSAPQALPPAGRPARPAPARTTAPPRPARPGARPPPPAGPTRPSPARSPRRCAGPPRSGR